MSDPVREPTGCLLVERLLLSDPAIASSAATACGATATTRAATGVATLAAAAAGPGVRNPLPLPGQQ